MAPHNDSREEIDQAYDDTIVEAINAVIDEDPERLDPPADWDNRYTAAKFASHLVEMVRQADAQNNRKLPHSKLAEWSGMAPGPARGLLGRHPLIPKVQATRAPLELSRGSCGEILCGVIKVYAGRINRTVTDRGVHGFSKGGGGRQLHLEFIVVSREGRAVLVNTERFAVEDLTTERARQYAQAQMSHDREGGQPMPERLAKYPEHVAAYYRDTWGRHRTGFSPHTIAEHVDALVAEARAAAKLVGAPELYNAMPIVGGQLIAITTRGQLPERPSLSLVGHDANSVDRLLALQMLPVLDLNFIDKQLTGAVADMPYRIELPRADGHLVPHDGRQLLDAACDPNRATIVPWSELRLAPASALTIAVSYIDGELDLSAAGARPVRVYYRAGYVPENLYLVPMTPSDTDTHTRALEAIMADATELHAAHTGRMTLVRATCTAKGAFDVGGRHASPAESVAAVARLAADRDLHRQFWLNR